jgi:phosphate transport system permease protein
MTEDTKNNNELSDEVRNNKPINKYLVHKPLRYGKKFYIGEFLAERIIQSIAILSIGFIIAIFYYVFQEATYAFKEPEKVMTELNSDNIKSISEKIIDGNADGETVSSKDDDLSQDSNSSDDSESSDELKPQSYSPDAESSAPVKKKEVKKEATQKKLIPTKPKVASGSDDDDLKPQSYSSDEARDKKVIVNPHKEEKISNEESQSPVAELSDTLKRDKANLAESIERQNTASNEAVTIKKLIEPNDYINDMPDYVWQPIAEVPKYSFIPLFIGALKVTLIGIIIAAPIAILAAIFTVAFAPRWMKEILKPSIEILAGFPSIVIGFFCLMTLATVVQDLFGTVYRLNSFVGGLGMAIAVIPIIYTVTEDALSAIPKYMKEASLALGASRWQTAYRVILPAATPGVFAAIILGFGRAFGETMIALMATGNAALVSSDIFESVRTMSATIGAEMAEVEFHGIHYGVLFLIGAVLFVITFSLNAIAEFYVRKRLMKKFQGK